MRGGFAMRGGFHAGGAPPFHGKPPPFDLYNSNDVFADRVVEHDETALTKEVMAVSMSLVPSEDERSTLAAFTSKVNVLLSKLVGQDVVSNVKIDSVAEVGSFKKDTMLAGHGIADISVIISTLPSFEAIATLGHKLSEDLRQQNEVVMCVSRDFGLQLSTATAHVRVLISTIPSNVKLLEADVHLPEKVMMKNFFSGQHAAWFADVQSQVPLKDLVRVIKDVRRRFIGLQALSTWVIEFLCYFCLANTSNRATLPLGPAFRRFFEAISAGILLPGTSSLMDPVEPRFRIGIDLTLEQMDEVCCTAQTLLRVISHGGHGAVLGTVPYKDGVDVSKEVSVWNGVTVNPMNGAVESDCMMPMFEDLPVAPSSEQEPMNTA